MNFDINAMESVGDRTFDVNVGQRADGSPVGFRVVGPSSEPYQKVVREIELLNVKQSAARGKPLDLTTDEGAAVVVDGGNARRDLLLAACVVDWYGFTFGETEPAAFSAESFARVMKAKPAWRVKLLAAIEEDANFGAG